MPPKKNNPRPTTAQIRSTQPHNSYKHIAVIFVVLAIILILGVTYLALSKVTITLIPSDKQIQYNFNLILAENPENNTSTDAILPGTIISDSQQITQTFSVEDGKTIDGFAQGTVTLYNERSTAQTLVATTRLLSPDNVLFRLKDKVTIPANSSIKAKIIADKKGAQGNIPPTAFIIPGLSEPLQQLVYAKSTSSMVGGTRQIGVLTKADIERAEQEFTKTNSDNIITELLSQTKNKQIALIEATSSVSELEYNEQIGQEVDSFTLSGTINIQTIFADSSKILTLAKSKVKESRKTTNSFINVDPNSLNYELISINLEKKEAKIKVSISGLATLDPEKDIFDKNLLVGFTEKDLKLYFLQFESIKEIKIEFSPFWVKKVPILKDHIVIKISK